MAVKRIDLSWITVSSTDKALHLFKDILGLKVTSEAQEYGWYELQGTEGGMHLGIGKEYHNKAGHNAVVTFVVDDIVMMKKEMEQKNIRFDGDIMEVEGHVKLATFYDVDNNKFQLVEEINTKE